MYYKGFHLFCMCPSSLKIFALTPLSRVATFFLWNRDACNNYLSIFYDSFLIKGWYSVARVKLLVSSRILEDLHKICSHVPFPIETHKLLGYERILITVKNLVLHKKHLIFKHFSRNPLQLLLCFNASFINPSTNNSG